MDNGVYLDNIDKKIKREVYITLKEIIKKYPRLNNSICLVSDMEYLLNIIYNKYKIEDNNKYKPSDKTIFTTCGIWTKSVSDELCLYDKIMYDKPEFIGIGIVDSIDYKFISRQLKSDYNNNWSYSRNIRDALYHEIGHVFEKLFKLTSNHYLIQVISDNIDKYNTSMYSKINYQEFIAEMFSKYSYDPRYNDMVYIIGNIINEFYYKFEDTELFDVSSNSLIKKI